MSDAPDRLTILEMEYALVSARLQALDARLALIEQRIDRLDRTGAKAAELADLSGRFDTFVDEWRRSQ